MEHAGDDRCLIRQTEKANTGCQDAARFRAYNWTGLYIGGDGGFGSETSSETLTDASSDPLTSYHFGANGPFAGGFVGTNYQFNRFVVGLEGDAQRANLIGNSQALAPLGTVGTFSGGPFTISTTVKDYGSFRARLGVAYDRLLLFGTVGMAWANPSTAYALTVLPLHQK